MGREDAGEGKRGDSGRHQGYREEEGMRKWEGENRKVRMRCSERGIGEGGERTGWMEGVQTL